MKDGLYQVRTKDVAAGFVILEGAIEACAPILKKNILFWMKLAKPVKEHELLEIYAKQRNNQENSPHGHRQQAGVTQESKRS